MDAFLLKSPQNKTKATFFLLCLCALPHLLLSINELNSEMILFTGRL